MKVITVVGEEGSGKTTLLKYVYELLNKDDADIDSANTRLEGHNNEDIVSLFNWHGKTIVLCSIGDDATKYDNREDYLEYVKYGTNLAIKEDADILLNALTSSISYTDLKNLLNLSDAEKFYRSFTMNRYEKNETDKQNKQKENTCQEILKLMELD